MSSSIQPKNPESHSVASMHALYKRKVKPKRQDPTSRHSEPHRLLLILVGPSSGPRGSQLLDQSRQQGANQGFVFSTLVALFVVAARISGRLSLLRGTAYVRARRDAALLLFLLVLAVRAGFQPWCWWGIVMLGLLAKPFIVTSLPPLFRLPGQVTCFFPAHTAFIEDLVPQTPFIPIAVLAHAAGKIRHGFVAIRTACTAGTFLQPSRSATVT